MSDYSHRLVDLYELYLEKCKESATTPIPFGQFKRWTDEQLAGLVAGKLADQIGQEDWENTLYVCMRVKDMPRPVSHSIVGECSRCRQKVWISPAIADKAVAAKAIVCDRCASSLTGRPMDDIINDELTKLEDSDV